MSRKPKENSKTEMIGIRVTPDVHDFLKNFAYQKEMTIQGIINELIMEMYVKYEAHKKTSDFFGFPFRMVQLITTSEEWEDFAKLIGNEKCNAYQEKWFDFYNDLKSDPDFL